ncbi:MAG: hypothetical protein ACHQHN_18245, partial [Sphingobacteriales bacterium]
YNVSLKLGSNQAEWNWTAILQNGKLIARTQTNDGYSPVISSIGKDKIKVSDLYLMGSDQTTLTKWNKPASKSTSIYAFWNQFKNAVVQKDYKKISQLTYFPFLRQGTYLNEQAFSQFRFSDNDIRIIKTSKAPVKSTMFFGGGRDSQGNLVNVNFAKGTIFEAVIGGPTIYFSNINGGYKFIAILYGE